MSRAQMLREIGYMVGFPTVSLLKGWTFTFASITLALLKLLCAFAPEFFFNEIKSLLFVSSHISCDHKRTCLRNFHTHSR